MLIQLTNRAGWEKFYLNSSLVETVYEREGNTSEIRLTTGRYVTCVESPMKVAALMEKIADKIEELRKA